MKKTALMLGMAVAASSAIAELSVNDHLSVSGYVDASGSYFRVKESDSSGVASRYNDNTFKVDTVELAFHVKYEPVAAQIEVVAFELDDVELQQVFVSYSTPQGLTVTTGRFFSELGLEGPKPTDRKFFTRAFEMRAMAVWSSMFGVPLTLNPVPDLSYGAKAEIEHGNSRMYITIQDGAWYSDGRLGGDRSIWGSSNWGTELGLTVEALDNLTIYFGSAYERARDSMGLSSTSWLGDVHATYTLGDLVIAGEFMYGRSKYINTDTGYWAQIAVSKSLSESLSLAGRVSYADVDAGVSAMLTSGMLVDDVTMWKYSVAPSYAWTDNLRTTFELSHSRMREKNAGIKTKEWMVGIQQIFSF